jgi:[acyl-carrier-protein] S-malonyltransferase
MTSSARALNGHQLVPVGRGLDLHSPRAKAVLMPTSEPANTVLIFPGMGPYGYAELGKFLVTNRHARSLRRAADAVLGYSLMDKYRRTGEDYSECSQVAFLVSCLALANWAEEELEIEPIVCCGASFGEKSAVAYSGALPFTEAVALTARIARCEEQYFRREHQSVVTQSVARISEAALRDISAGMTARGEWHEISGYIDDEFYMVSMDLGHLENFTREVRAKGGMPLYAMRPPMHSSAFGPLRQKVAEILDEFRFGDPRLPIIADQDGSVIVTADEVKGMLLDSFTQPVRWPDTVRSMKELGVTKAYVAGPDGLFGRVGCAIESFQVITVNPRMALTYKGHVLSKVC